ncbi:MAG: HupE/UreJ family protein [Chthoniobacteraceae bacterium]
MSKRGACLRVFFRLAAIAAVAVLLSGIAGAHTADTSYARVRILGERIEVRLTLDAFTLLRIVPALDANQDRALSREELRAATPAVQQFLAEHVGLEVNGAAARMAGANDPFWPLDAPDPIPSSLWHTNEALISFPFDIPLSAPAKDVALLFDVFRVLGDAHSILGVFEYRGTSTQVVLNVAESDFLFDVAFAGAPQSAANDPAAAARTSHRSNVDDSPVWRFFKMGVGHILTGYDHLCFLLALLIVSRLRPLVAIVTSFTVAHSITLLLAAFGIVTLPTRWIECAIALTIVYVGAENLWRKDCAHRWLLTFFFGLIHGFGFANTLDPQELPLEAKAKCLVVFNLGVEAGQLAVVLVLLPVSLALARWEYGARAKTAVSIVVALLGLAWFLDRVFALGWMPF